MFPLPSHRQAGRGHGVPPPQPGVRPLSQAQRCDGRSAIPVRARESEGMGDVVALALRGWEGKELRLQK